MAFRSMAAALAAALAMLAGCGGGDDDKPGGQSASGGGSALSKEEFIRRADNLCREFRSKSLAGANPQTFDELRRTIDEVLPPAQRTLKKFQRLKPPPGDERIIRSYLDAQRETLSLLRQLGDAAEAGDREAAERYADALRESGGRAKRIAQGYGFKVCGSDETATA